VDRAAVAIRPLDQKDPPGTPDRRRVCPDVQVPADLRVALRMIDKDHLEIQFTYKDDTVLEEPYKFTWTYTRHDEHKVMEYVCDNNKYTIGPDGTVQFNIDD